MALGRRYVEAPNVPPLPYGLLSAALVINDGDPHLGMGTEYESLACSAAHLTASECFTQAGDPPAGLTAQDGINVIDGDPFVVYALHRCRNTPGMSPVADAEARLTLGQSRAIEQQFATGLTDSTDLTPVPGTGVAPVVGLAILEQYAAENYGGVPTIHIPRGVGTILGADGAIERVSGRLETVQGSAVASGGGYPTAGTVGSGPGVTAGAGERWLRATGFVTVRLGGVSVSDQVQGLDTGAAINEYLVLAQRPVVVTAECFDVAVLVTTGEDG